MSVNIQLVALIRKLRPYFMVLGALAILAGFVISRVMISVGMFIWIGVFLVNPDIRDDIRVFLSRPSLWVLTLLFFLYVVYGLGAENQAYWWERLRIKLPFLGIPLAVVTLRVLRRRTFLAVYYFFFWVMAAATVVVFVNYVLHFRQFNELLRMGQPIPVPYSHIRFSLMVVMGIITGIYLYSRGFILWFRKERPVQLLVILWMIVFLHVLSVRSGLAALYLVAAVSVIYLVVVHRKWVLGLGLMLLLAGAPLLAYFTIDSFRGRVDYARYDFEQYFRNHNPANTSDGRRIVSVRAGVAAGLEKPWFGQGTGDVMNRLNAIYAEKYPFMTRNFIIHNQWVFFFASMGLSGLVLTFVVLVFPLLYRKRFRHWLFLNIYLVLLITFMVEATLEGQIGTSIFLFFIPFTLVWLDREQSEEEKPFHPVL